jgi:hypothetical protein
MRGKGSDLADESEVKAANTLDAIDTPRWNHHLPNPPAVNRLLARPSIYYVLFDTLARDSDSPFRCRVWRVFPQRDEAFQKLVQNWAKSEDRGDNMQIQPPRWNPHNIAKCFGVRIRMPLLLHAEQQEIGTLDFVSIVKFRPNSKARSHMVKTKEINDEDEA